MKKNLVFFLFFSLLLIAPQCPSNIDIKIVLDNAPVPSAKLENIQGEGCKDIDSSIILHFSALYDPIEGAIDDEIYFGLEIKLKDISQIESGVSYEVENNPNMSFSASVLCFCMPPLDPLTTVSGTFTITKIFQNMIDGKADLKFTDPNDVNTVVHDSLIYKVDFKNIDIGENCVE